MVFSNSRSEIYDSMRSTNRKVLATRRPRLLHLNADTTWLIQLPYPVGVPNKSHRAHFNILIDPWLRGRQSDVASWFSSQWHAIDSSVQTIAELNRLLRQNEASLKNIDIECQERANHVDVVVVSHEFTDHCHKATLLELDRSTPVFATSKAAVLIRSWKHFKHVYEPPPFSKKMSDWRASSLHSLPHWLSISRIVNESDALYYHSAILVSFELGTRKVDSPQESCGRAEGMIYTPHGIHAQELSCLRDADPPLNILGLMHGLHDVRLSKRQLNLGGHNGLQAQRICQAKYWVSTHDEVKKARGLIAPILSRKVLTLKEVLDEEKRKQGGGSLANSNLADFEDVEVAELKSGECLVLQ
ncbi:uncharacterized protein KY384_001578 [Bacidia gigantensis]|uniref:uncharacterized protein n=1 Tax=Bacidia gigantensis TaxID=2732470 RepID=UPI001D058702|nr:uncharacterized protein KY384_001578 [Bacidia gigantensis]KAG8533837.1 hypothetical protein KY384_001578 [Bacidia gigantensis]